MKAFPQPSQHYEETVCCAGLRERDGRLVRLYPIRYRHLPKDKKFSRYDTISAELWKPLNDTRPESFRVIEDSIMVEEKETAGRKLKIIQKWMSLKENSMTELFEKNRTARQSIGIIKPDTSSLKFTWSSHAQSDASERETTETLRRIQESIFDAPLPPLQKEYTFRYRFTSCGKSHTCQILDWEVQAAYYNYLTRYGDKALAKLQEQYEKIIPQQNLHFIMGNTAAHQSNFSIIGVLRIKNKKSHPLQPELF